MFTDKRYIRNLFFVVCSVACCLVSFTQSKRQDNLAEKKKIAAQMRSSMVNHLLKPWYPLSIDAQYGGFLSSFTYDFKPAANQQKMIVTQARHIWSTSKAAEMFPDSGYYKAAAAHGFQFLKAVMWDKKYGGFYTYVDRQGKVIQGGFSPKEAYGNSFAIYGLAAYYHLSGDTSALNLAIAGFRWLEKHSHDPLYKGYFQHMERDGTPIKRTDTTPSTAETGYKDQNTSIHLLEAFNELYAVWPDSLLKARLSEMLLLIRDKIVSPAGYLNLFFYRDWTPLTYRDSSQEVIMAHHWLNHVSFGHDIETAYLMLEASHTLGIKKDTLTLKVGKKMLDHALDNGYDHQVGGFYDEGYYFKDKPGMTIIADTKNWWAQAEGLNTLLIMDSYFPNDPHQYFTKFKQQWHYVQTYLIDTVHGDWYQGGLDKQPNYKMDLKGQIWKGTYHNLRGLMNCIQSLEPDQVPPAAPNKLKLSQQHHTRILSWTAVKNKKTFIGYNIYLGGKRTWYTPLNKLILPNKINGRLLSVTAVDRFGNESKVSKPIKLY